jgi:PAS domain S-box-containing protein
VEVKARTRYYSKNGTFCVRPSGEITAWETAAEKILGYSAEETVGNYCFDLLGKGGCYGNPCFPKCKILNNARQSRSSKDFSATWKCKDGELLSVDVTTITRDSKGTGKEVLHIFRENTTERRLNRMVAHALSMGEDLSGVKLTPRERQVLLLAAGGLSTLEIAAELNIARVTARNTISFAMNKLSATNRTQAVMKALVAKLI